MQNRPIRNIFDSPQRLIDAASRGEVQIVQQYLNRHRDDAAALNVTLGDGHTTALIAAAREGQTEVVRILLANRLVSLSQTASFYDLTLPLSAAEYAYQNGHEEVVQLIREAGIARNESIVTDTIMSYQYFFDAIANNRKLAIEYYAAKSPYLINHLFIHERQANYSYYGDTPLTFACRLGHRDLVRYLISLPTIDINLYNHEYMTPLMVAARYGHGQIVRLLLAEPSTDILFRREQNYTYNESRGISALELAQQYHHLSCVELINNALAARGLTEENNERRNSFTPEDAPMPHALLNWFRNEYPGWFRSGDYLGELRGRRADINLINVAAISIPDSIDDLIIRGQVQRWIRIQQRVYRQENPEAPAPFLQPPRLPAVDPSERPAPQHPFLRAAFDGDLGSVQAQLANNVAQVINTQDDVSNTALIYASHFGRSEIVDELLLHRELDIGHQNAANRSAAYYAQQQGYDEIATRITRLHEDRLRAQQESNAAPAPEIPAAPSTGYQARMEALKHPVDLPHDLACPVSREIMNDPIKVSSGKIFDRKSLIDYFDSQGNPDTIPCPMTRITIRKEELRNPTDADTVKAINDFLTVEEAKDAKEEAEAQRKQVREARLRIFEGGEKKADNSSPLQPPKPK